MSGKYPSLEHFSKIVGIPSEALVQGYEVEKVFHQRIIQEQDQVRRQTLYQEMYDTVHAIYGSVPSADVFDSQVNPKEHTIWLFSRELAGKSVLDVGCGRGAFLVGIARTLPHGHLLGLDAAVPEHRDDIPVRFQKSDIVQFETAGQFDVVFSDNVIEHVAPADLDTHLQSVRNALVPGGTFIVLTPNRLFGPWDVTRIIDDSYANKIKAQGSHLNEITYRELMAALRRNGFRDFTTVMPLAKIRKRFGGIRFPAGILAALERVPVLVGLAQRVPEKWRILPAFEISIICRKI